MVLAKRVKMLRWHNARGAVSVHTLVDCLEIAIYSTRNPYLFGKKGKCSQFTRSAILSIHATKCRIMMTTNCPMMILVWQATLRFSQYSQCAVLFQRDLLKVLHLAENVALDAV